MRRLVIAVLMAVLLSVTAVAQSGSITEEARAKLAKERHAVKVGQAQQLIEKQEKLEAKLARVKQALADLDAGKKLEFKDFDDILVEDTHSCLAYSSGGSLTCSSCVTWTSSSTGR